MNWLNWLKAATSPGKVLKMSIVEYKSSMPVSGPELFAWHERPAAFERLMPPWGDVRIVSRDVGIGVGATTVLSIPMGPIRMKWVARHTRYEPPTEFQDEQVRGPFAKWLHTHRCLDAAAGVGRGGVLADRIEFEPPLGKLGAMLGGGMIRRQLDQTFFFRHTRTARDLRRHERFRQHGSLKVAITGASGLVGKELRAFLSTGGHEVRSLVRRAADKAKGEIAWDPEVGSIDHAGLEGVDGVVHLAGENLASGRWTAEKKRRFVTSRVGPTRLLCETLAKLAKPPRVLISASAIGFYGDRGEDPIDEYSAKGKGFLPDLCEAWEGATRPAEDAGIRIVHLRIGVVLSAHGGALKKMVTPFKMGGGGTIGSGRQYMSWISLDDLVGAIHHALFDETLRGPINAVAPEPATNRDFVKTLAKVLHRPSFVPMPATMVKLLFGEMGKAILLEGAKVIPRRLKAAGFEWGDPSLEPALRAEVGNQLLPDGWGDTTGNLPGKLP